MPGKEPGRKRKDMSVRFVGIRQAARDAEDAQKHGSMTVGRIRAHVDSHGDAVIECIPCYRDDFLKQEGTLIYDDTVSTQFEYAGVDTYYKAFRLAAYKTACNWYQGIIMAGTLDMEVD